MAPRLRILAGLVVVAGATVLVPAGSTAAAGPLRFYAVRPCRIVDTRGPSGPNGGPALSAGATRSFVLTGQCGISPTAGAVSANVTVTGSTSGGFVALYPDGPGSSGVSTINFQAGQTRANNAILGLGPAGGVTARLGQPTGSNNLILDVNGYFDDPANNQPPVVTAGPGQSIVLPATAALSATASDDGKPSTSLTYQWSKVSGPGAVTFSAPTALSTTASFAVAGPYVVRFSASDSLLANSADVPVNVDVSNDTLRFLSQATWGANEALIAELTTKPLAQWIDEQIASGSAAFPNLPLQPTTVPPTCDAACRRDNYTMYPLQNWLFLRALYNGDPLRQRVVWALHKILVVSGRDITQPSWMAPYLNILDRNAFGNYRQILGEITLNPGMGRYLDMVTSTRTNPNENYAREVMQLFSIGTVLLNIDGTPVLDVDGNPFPAYDQSVVDAMAKVFTGWTLAPQPAPGIVNYVDPMRLVPGNHDSTDKTLPSYPELTSGLVAGQTGDVDLDIALNNIYYHQNAGPFIGRQLIQHLVTSNPSPAYVGRIAAVFNANKASPGQLGAVVKAILLDPEARGGASGRAADGHLDDPVLLMTRLLRAFSAKSFSLAGFNDGVLNPQAANMGQDIFRPETVFSYYPADFVLPGTTDYAAPEYGTMAAVTALRRANFVNTMVYTGIPVSTNAPQGTALDFSTYIPYAGDAAALVDRLDRVMTGRSLSVADKSAIVTAVAAIPASSAKARVQQAAYLIATSAQFQVQR